jgi:membrane peptidoglycan carboxypeptidase
MVMDRGGIWSYLLGWRQPTGVRVAGYVAEAYVHGRELEHSWTTSVFRGHLRWKWTVWALAMWVARNWDAQDATATWATSAFFGNGAVGIQAASTFYFNKVIVDLTDDEAALLAAVNSSPRMNDPACRPDAAKEARDKILGRMRAAGMLDDAATQRAIGRPILVRSTCQSKM